MATPTNPKPGPYDIGPFQEIVKLQWGGGFILDSQFLGSDANEWWYNWPGENVLRETTTSPANIGNVDRTWVIRTSAGSLVFFNTHEELRTFLYDDYPFMYWTDGQDTFSFNLASSVPTLEFTDSGGDLHYRSTLQVPRQILESPHEGETGQFPQVWAELDTDGAQAAAGLLILRYNNGHPGPLTSWWHEASRDPIQLLPELPTS